MLVCGVGCVRLALSSSQMDRQRPHHSLQQSSVRAPKLRPSEPPNPMQCTAPHRVSTMEAPMSGSVIIVASAYRRLRGAAGGSSRLSGAVPMLREPVMGGRCSMRPPPLTPLFPQTWDASSTARSPSQGTRGSRARQHPTLHLLARHIPSTSHAPCWGCGAPPASPPVG